MILNTLHFWRIEHIQHSTLPARKERPTRRSTSAHMQDQAHSMSQSDICAHDSEYVKQTRSIKRDHPTSHKMQLRW